VELAVVNLKSSHPVNVSSIHKPPTRMYHFQLGLPCSASTFIPNRVFATMSSIYYRSGKLLTAENVAGRNMN
jgi:hypothetical protein